MNQEIFIYPQLINNLLDISILKFINNQKNYCLKKIMVKKTKS